MAYNAARRRDVREAEKLEKLTELQRLEIVRGIMSLIPGRSWMCDLLEFCHIFGTTFSPNPGVAAFNEGQRNVGLRLLNDLMAACPDQYVQMMNERNERNVARDSRTDDRDNADSGELPGSEEPGRVDEGRTVGGVPAGEQGDASAEAGTGAESWRDEVYAEYEREQAKLAKSKGRQVEPGEA